MRPEGQRFGIYQLFYSKKGKHTLFEKHPAHYGTRHKLIKPYTPCYNGKVVRSRRKDNEYSYASDKFYYKKILLYSWQRIAADTTTSW